MIVITKQFRAEIAHRLPGHNAGCRFIHGHSYLFEISLTAHQMTSLDMVMDFHDLKEIMSNVIGEWDHSLVLFEDDPLVEVLDKSDLFGMVNLVTIPFIPTAENMANYLAHKVQQEIDDADPVFANNPVVNSVKVWETATSYAEWREA